MNRPFQEVIDRTPIENRCFASPRAYRPATCSQSANKQQLRGHQSGTSGPLSEAAALVHC